MHSDKKVLNKLFIKPLQSKVYIALLELKYIIISQHTAFSPKIVINCTLTPFTSHTHETLPNYTCRTKPSINYPHTTPFPIPFSSKKKKKPNAHKPHTHARATVHLSQRV